MTRFCYHIVCIAFGLFLFSCKNYQEVRVSSINNFKVTSITVKGIEAEVSVNIDNPNPIGFYVFRSKTDVTYGDLKLGTARLTKRTHIPPNSKNSYTFVLKGSFKDATLSDIGGLLGGRKKVEIKGNLKVGRFLYRKKIPIDQKQVMNLMR